MRLFPGYESRAGDLGGVAGPHDTVSHTVVMTSLKLAASKFVICESHFILLHFLSMLFPPCVRALVFLLYTRMCFILLLKYFLMFLAQITNLGLSVGILAR